jgi:hypothetical protein
MSIGPQIECRRCSFPMLLAFIVTVGARRRLTCSVCGRSHEWVLGDVGDWSGDAAATTAGPESSVE